MNTTKTAASTTTTVVITGTVRSPLTLTRSLPDRIARVSFRVDGEDGPYNVHATGERAEMLRAGLRKGDRVTIAATRASTSHPAQTVPDLELETITLEVARHSRDRRDLTVQPDDVAATRESVLGR